MKSCHVNILLFAYSKLSSFHQKKSLYTLINITCTSLKNFILHKVKYLHYCETIVEMKSCTC